MRSHTDTPSLKWTKLSDRLSESLIRPQFGIGTQRRTSPSYCLSERTGHNSPPEYRNSLCDHNSESTLRDGRQGAGFYEFRFGAEIGPRNVCTSTPIVEPLGSMRIFVRPAIGTAREAPIRNQHFDPVRTRRGSPTPSASDSDRKLCSTRRENSSPGRRYGCINIADIVNPSGRIRRFPVRRPNSSPGAWSRAADAITYGHPFAQTGKPFRSVIRIAYKTPIWNRHSEAYVAPFLPQAIRRRFGVEKPSFRTPKVRFQPTLFPFRRKAYVTTIRNRHSETVDGTLVSWNSVPGPKLQSEACVLVHRLSHPLDKMRIFVRAAIGTALDAPIRNQHFDPVGTMSDSEISCPTPKFLSGSVVASCRCD
ncbi:hypothetical protein Taro_029166, partial [Colocasia esculenta]|nr:hypothetical protein [Colocasia esculenta]